MATHTEDGAAAVSVWRSIKADPRRYFSEEEIAKSKAYQRPLTYLGLASTAIGLVTAVAYIGFQVGPRLTDFFAVTPWPLQVIVVLSGLIVLSTITSIPVSLYRTFVHENKWGFNTQTFGGWVTDGIKGLLIGLVLANALFLVLWAIVRATDLWWLLGAVVLTLFAVILAAIAPVVIMPLFNKFAPVEDEELRERLRRLAISGGIRLKDVEVMDASKRTRHDNAFFTGLGKTKKVVIFDNMLEWDRNLIDVVVAHEVGHWRHRHLIRSVLLGTLTTFLVFAGLRFLMQWEAALAWAGAESVGDPAALPLFLLGFGVGASITSLIDAWISRAHERQADLFALDLTKDTEAYARVWKEFSTKDLPDLDPSWWKRIRGSHPPLAERMAFGDSWASR